MKRTLLVTLMLCVLCHTKTMAQQAYKIYPVPQTMTINSGVVPIDLAVNVVCESGIDEATRQRAAAVLQLSNLSVTFSDAVVPNALNVLLGIRHSAGMADQFLTQQNISTAVFDQANKYDKHVLSIRQVNGTSYCVIVGEHTDAVFHALASVEQMLEQSAGGFTSVDIADYADQKYRGLVEGYYGYPYTVTVKKDLMRFMMRMKMNTYLYGAKSDPYHSLYWRDAYPVNITARQEKEGWLTQGMLRDLASVSAQTKVNFIWAIHPAAASAVDFSSTATAEQGVNDVFAKLSLMYQLGLRQFAVFVDDAGQNIAHRHNYAHFFTKLQQKLDTTYNMSGRAPADTVKPLHVVPHVYTLTWVGQEARDQYFEALSHTPAHIVYYTTGWGVWSVPNSSDLAIMKRILGREVAWWWNYPCNDNADSRLYTADMYTNFHDAPSINSGATLPASLNQGLGIVSNPMQEGELSKIALFSVADYAWNNDGFNHQTSWENALRYLFADDVRESVKTFLKYARHFEPAALNTLINNYKQTMRGEQADTILLERELSEILAACRTMRSLASGRSEQDSLFFVDVQPWVEKLEAMAEMAQQFIALRRDINPETSWQVYLQTLRSVNSLDTAERFKAYSLEGHGNGISVASRPATPSAQYLEPFVRYMAENGYNDLLPARRPSAVSPTFITNQAALQNNTVNSVTPGQYFLSRIFNINPGKYVGIAFPQAQRIDSIHMAESLSSLTVYYSTDAKTWRKHTPGVVPPVHIRYITFVNETDADIRATFNRSRFMLYFPTVARPATISTPQGSAWNGHTKELMTDGNYETFAVLDRNQANADAYTYSYAQPTPVYDVRVCVGTVNGDHYNVAKVQVSADSVNWKSLKVKGTQVTEATMGMAAVVRYSNEMSYCDFDGTGEAVKYVRLYLERAHTDKWLRLYEIEVNRRHADAAKMPVASLVRGGAQAAVTDDKAATRAVLPNAGTMIYRLLSHEKTTHLRVYQNADALRGSSIGVRVSADSVNWVEKGSISSHYAEIALSDMPDNIKYVAFTWQGVAPEIYEISEKTEVVPLIITRIEAVAQTSERNELQVTVVNGGLDIVSASPIKAACLRQIDGRVLLSRQSSLAETALRLPVPSAAQGRCLILTVTLPEGQERSYKLFVK